MAARTGSTASAGGAPARDSAVDREELFVSLDDPRSLAESLTGAKAAALAKAHSLGLPVLGGFAITTNGSARIIGEPENLASIGEELRGPWATVTRGGTLPLVVRSSSTAEDGSSSSMAGMFTSVTNVSGWEAFLDAVVEVVSSSARVQLESPAPMAVLVQPFLNARLGGVMFGIDPVTGLRDRLVVAAAEGPPEKLVSGEVQGARYVMRPDGRLIQAEAGGAAATLGHRQRRALAHLAQQAQRSFGAPQDVEWAFDADGRLWLLQSRPVTAVGFGGEPTGPVLGPGPVAETFPQALSALEEDLWVGPLREGIRHALSVVKTAPRRRIDASVIVTTVEGRVAADLELLGSRRTRKSWLARLDPRPPARRLRASWDVGRLRAALPSLVDRLVLTVDDELAKLPPLCEMTDAGMVDLLTRSESVLVALHGHEVLAGMLLGANATAPTAASLGLRALADARSTGLDDAEATRRSPVILALTPPAVGRRTTLPAVLDTTPAPSSAGDPLARARERARLRARWVQELTARICEEAARRLCEKETLRDFDDVHLLTRAELIEALDNGLAPVGLMDRAPRAETPPLPAAFRLSSNGAIVAERSEGSKAQGAGGGRGKGPVCTDPAAVKAGDVLVVHTLDPDLAAALPSLGGLISETGSVLSHLAILAREFGVPTVVNVDGAVTRWAPGTDVIVDGSTGEVTAVEQSAR